MFAVVWQSVTEGVTGRITWGGSITEIFRDRTAADAAAAELDQAMKKSLAGQKSLDYVEVVPLVGTGGKMGFGGRNTAVVKDDRGWEEEVEYPFHPLEYSYHAK